MSPDPRIREGVAAGLGAYLIWGLVPIFFKWLGAVPADEIIAHRIVWSLIVMAAVLAFGSNFAQVRAAVRSPAQLARVSLGALLVSTNWLVFVYAVNTDRILATSLGYFILPMVSVSLGVVVLGERLRPLQWLAVSCATIGIVAEAVHVGELPWISLALAGTFGLYGLLRKRLSMDAASGLFLETACMLPLALAYLAWIGATRGNHFGESTPLSLLLVASGVVTALPLWLFGISARRLPLITIGFMQYSAPMISAAIAIAFYGEPVDTARIVAFAAIWIGIALYSADLWRHARTPG